MNIIIREQVMRGPGIKTLYIIFISVTISNSSIVAQCLDMFMDYRNIVLSERETIKADSASIEWGKRVLEDLNFESATDFEKAAKIQQYLSNNFKYRFKSDTSISGIINSRGGNCVSHAILGIFLLRLEGVKAKFAYEVQIIKPFTIVSIVVGRWAKKNNDGINSYWHNDHVWVWFDNNGSWEPFDSALGLCGFDEFYDKRFYKHKELSRGMAQKWAGPPFVVWEETDMGRENMNNITHRIWNEETLEKFNNRTEWLNFINLFDNWSDSDFHKEFLPEDLLNEIKVMSRKWFSNQQ